MVYPYDRINVQNRAERCGFNNRLNCLKVGRVGPTLVNSLGWTFWLKPSTLLLLDPRSGGIQGHLFGHFSIKLFSLSLTSAMFYQG